MQNFDLSEALERSRIEDVETFMRVLGQIPVFCDFLHHAVLDFDADGRSWKIVSERGTAHLVYLFPDVQKIAKRYDKPTRYTKPTYGDDARSHSFVASLAFWLGRMLPKDARPKSEGALIALLARQPAG